MCTYGVFSVPTCLVVPDDRTNKNSSFVTVVPITDAVQQDKLSGYAFIGSYGMSEENIAVIEQITTLNKIQLLVKVGATKALFMLAR